MASSGNQSTGQERSRRKSRARGGLGQGLGALIPDAEPVHAKEEKPLDILFPDLTGNSKPASARGGSARELLSPRPGRKSVSRETSVSSAPEAFQSADSHPEGVASVRGAPSRGARIVALGGDNVEENSTARGDRPSRAGTVSRETKVEGQRKPSSQPRAKRAKPSNEEHSPAAQHLPEPGSGGLDDLSGAKGVNDVSRETEEIIPGLSEGQPLAKVPGATFGQVPPEWIIPNLKQPRQVFDEDELDELAKSLAEVGVLQPVVVRRITAESLAEEGQAGRLEKALEEQPDARYELIMGERRWRASRRAGLETIPMIVRDTTEDELLREALIENIHRVQLNALEEAAAYQQLIDDFGYSQEQLSERVSKSRSQVANTLRLLRLPASIQRMLAAGVLSPGHARALLSLKSESQMLALADRIVSEGLSVRGVEDIVRVQAPIASTPKARNTAAPSAEALRIADAMSEMLSTTVKVMQGAKKGKVVIEFADAEDLHRIFTQLQSPDTERAGEQ